MKNEKDKIKEPYTPEQTPSPPQIIDPSGRKERGENDRPVEQKGKQVSDKDRAAAKGAEGDKEAKPGKSEPVTDDGTTI